MEKERINELVGKSFEELSLEEMEKMQGAANIEARSTPTVAAITSPEMSAMISAATSVITASIAATFAKKCKK
ncbi:lichenicidin A2 family type 2 lantibiotic [Lactococcus lactis]|jgi:type 2 lantibiotic (TIGR03893 family)|uniref:lichenicidin A2 family type 2 lantibiotic n=1 Tax=Lactococcus lactis TaxID=1358 RepID=UPI002062C189|nr:lichenicidin A2 family type 2 lantibiotic [Lactococcus lactis]MDG4973405.1 lichenicidin A2 family type 2 lantibiotic [Lactococcus lactis]BDH82207.1 hypothetical protein LLL8_18640 [Lactococcus lactis]